MADSTSRTDIVFVVMPFADVDRPAIGVSLLKAAACAAGWSASIEYCNVAFAARVGPEPYAAVANALAPDVLAGEWLFADDVFGDRIPPAEEYLERVLSGNAPAELLESIGVMRTGRGEYLEACAARVLAHRPRVVGFTTTFHQTCACLAVARRLKEAAEPPIVVFGGANCEGEMGAQMLASFPWIDHVASGEADRSLPQLLDVLLGGASGPVRGVRSRGHDEAVNAPPVVDLDALPYPDYDDYFAQVRGSPIAAEVQTYLPVETSRGCWWGAKHHCTFCGLNGDSMAFRSKSPQRAFDELTWLARRYGELRFGVVDNILDLHYIDTLFPLLAEDGLELDLFYEVKANLRYEQLVQLHRGGIRQIQPGIESLSDDVLKRMDKGVSAAQNIALLRWCAELGIRCCWNVLAGFPGEPPAEYERMAELMPLLVHLDAPMSTAQVRLDRFSPFHARSEEYGFRRVRPSRAYFYVFPLGRREMARLAYYFDFDYADGRRPRDYTDAMNRAVASWWRGQNTDRPELNLDAEDDRLVVTDTRPVATAERHELDGVHARVYELCDVGRTRAALRRDPELAGADVDDALEALLADRLLAQIGDRYLALAVFRKRRPPRAGVRRATAAAA
ncbi:RiPP maturation radical SAM C-methyltransferase [Solirubrobacter phytolaccae]|uniref:RiPP maturation radical SAM C-methyltransferase n=1 Tax=Solirubrobacter phytolaccae TaxID=1404360 RepID=A0A9X3NCK3_9ACTN|nr:RiPP maturation radical SAM C-methyltransferase [Solirubrobacter phytolaccae]MDA0183988.1 RiPP maturation radical SAM C-methyltransferase [Solirubrobacter phytolaccae]